MMIAFTSSLNSQKDLDSMLTDIHGSLEKRAYEDALAKVSAALKRDPRNANLHFYNGRILQKSNQTEAALEQFNITLSLQPANLEALNYRARALGLLGKNKEALKDYNRLLTYPKYAVAYNYANRAWAKASLDQLDAALQDINTAIKMEPENLSYYENRAAIYDRNNQTLQAIDDLSYVIARTSDNAAAFAERGHVELKGQTPPISNRRSDDININEAFSSRLLLARTSERRITLSIRCDR